jgi:hypothetical protein
MASMCLASRAAGPVVAAVTLSVLAMACKKAAPRSRLDCFETPAWAEAGGLQLRAGSSGAALLLRHRTTVQRLHEDYPGSDPGVDPGQPAIYRYDPASTRLDAVAEDAWRDAGGEVVDCDRQSAASAAPFVLDASERTLRWRDRAVAVAGRTVLVLAAGPDGDRVAVLSARGSVAESVLPFLARTGTAGQHYHQVFSRRDASEQGEAVALPMTSKSVALEGCWSADGRYVVYTDALYNHLCIVQPEAAGGDRR